MIVTTWDHGKLTVYRYTWLKKHEARKMSVPLTVGLKLKTYERAGGVDTCTTHRKHHKSNTGSHVVEKKNSVNHTNALRNS